MKKTLKLMGLCALAVLALAGCKKNGQTGSMTFRATISPLNSNAKTHIGLIGTDTMLVWNEGDQIKVYTEDKTEANAANFTLATGENQTQATFTGDLAESDTYYAFYPTTGVELTGEGKFKLPVSGTQTFVDANFTTNTFPMCATTTDGNFTFHSPYGILGIPMKGTATIGSIVLTDSLGMNLVGYYEMNAEDTTFVGNSAAITLNFGEGLTLNETTATTSYFIVRAGAFTQGFKAEVKGTDGNTITVLQTSKNNIIVKEYIRLMPEVTGVNAPTPAPSYPDGYLPGIFTIDNTGRQIHFGKGNLQYQASTGTWRFADRQWDYVGTETGTVTGGTVYEGGVKCDNALISLTYSGWIDLFGWGTWTGSNPNPTNYVSSSDYYSFADSDFDQTLYGSDAWRTLNNNEWRYLFCTRPNADILCGLAKVDGNSGIVILPENWTLPSGSSFNPGLDCTFDINTYDVSQWAAMEAAGAVFLPAAGGRYETSVFSAGLGGQYWTSTRYNSVNAYEMIFSGYTNYLCDYEENNLYYGGSVRLVRDYDGTGGGGNPGAGLNGMQTGSSHGW